MTKRAMLLILTMILMIMPLTVYAEDGVPFSDTHFHSYEITLGTTDQGYLHIVFSIQAKQTAEIIGVPVFDIQQKIDGEWVTIESSLEGYLKSDSVSCTFSKNYTGAVIGEKYRIYAPLYIKKYDGTSRMIYYTSQSYTLGR